MIQIAIFTSILIYATVGFFMNFDITYTFLEYLMVITITVQGYRMLYELFVLLYYMKIFLDILDVSQIKFLKSILFIKNRNVLHTHRDKTIKITNLISILTIYLVLQWMAFPLMIETFRPSNTEIQRKKNVLNLPFPLTIHMYNKYFIIFYVFETYICAFFMYGLFMIDLFLLSFGWVIVVQYRVIIRAFEDIGQEFNSNINVVIVVLLVLFVNYVRNKNKKKLLCKPWGKNIEFEIRYYTTHTYEFF